jgi:shikimate kinase
MGSGKTTIAPILANTLGYDFIDMDKEIEAITGKKITEIFSDLGEQYFRDAEREILTRISRTSHCVVSLGGGTISDEVNCSIITSSGILVYLQSGVEHIYQRLKFKNDRPMLKGPDGKLLSDDDLRKRINDLLKSREQYYSRADITVSTGDLRVGLTVDRIVRDLRAIETKEQP